MAVDLGDPVVYIIAAVVVFFFFFLYLLVRRTLLSFREGVEKGKGR